MLKGEKGVTLLELMVALVLTALVGMAVFRVFKTNMDSWQKGEARTQRYQNARIALNRMSKEIRSAILLSTANNPGKDLRFLGTSSTLNFLTASHPPTRGAYENTYEPVELVFDVCEIGYSVDTTNKKLYRRKHRTNIPDTQVDGGGSSDVLALHVTELAFSYYDGSDWQTSWDSSTDGGLPYAVWTGLTLQADVAPAGHAKKEELISTKVYLFQR